MAPLRLPKKWSKVLSVKITCATCQAECSKTGPMQKYCEACSSERSRVRKLKWANKNPAPKGRVSQYRAAKRSRMLDAGAEVSDAHRSTLADIMPDATGLVWVRRVEVPFSYAASKNHLARMSPDGHVFLRKESRSFRQQITDTVSLAVRDAAIVTNKLWIDLIVQKPNHRGDAVNVLDLVVDAIKDACGLDDRWFSVKRLDWQVVKIDPKILIGLAQASGEESRVCSFCGRILPLGLFCKNRSMPNGVSRGCLECSRLGARGTRPKRASKVVAAPNEEPGVSVRVEEI